MSTSSLQTVEPAKAISSNATFISAAASQVVTKSAEVVEVWGRISNFVAGQLDSVDLLISPLDIDGSPIAATDFVAHGLVAVAIGADGMFFVETLARKNGDELGKVVKARYITSGGADFTIELFLVVKP